MIWCINIFLFNFTKYTMYFGMDIPIALLRPELILIVQILLMHVLFVPLYIYIFTPFGVQEYVRTTDSQKKSPIATWLLSKKGGTILYYNINWYKIQPFS